MKDPFRAFEWIVSMRKILLRGKCYDFTTFRTSKEIGLLSNFDLPFQQQDAKTRFVKMT